MMALLGARKGRTEGRGRRAAGFVRAAVHAMVRNLLLFVLSIWRSIRGKD